ncbi:hypothetical protein ACO0R3_003386 [Hanseniaspora guilliermondii]
MMNITIILYLFSFSSCINAFISIYDSSTYDNSLIPESIKYAYNYYSSNISNKYNLNKQSNDYKVIPDLLPGYQSIKNSNIYKKPKDMFSGRISINEELKHSLYFWKFNREHTDHDVDNNPLVFFINGGPGCSSMDGLLLENGPFRVDDDGLLTPNEGSWHMQADIVYIDQPLGTGFSTKLDSKEKDIDFYDTDLINDSSKNMIIFLIEYFKIFPHDKHKNIILAGESYAGQYILHFINNIWKFNKLIDEEGHELEKINVDTVMLGNAWVDPYEQSASYLPFFQKEGLFKQDNLKLKKILNLQEKCQQNINNMNIDDLVSDNDIKDCDSIMYQFISSVFDPTIKDQKDKCLNVYDYRLTENAPSCGMDWPYELPNINKFFHKEGVQEALNIFDTRDDYDTNDAVIKWTECSSKVGSFIKQHNRDTVPSIRILPSLLEQGLKLYLFNGDKDIICNHLGVENYVKKLVWQDKQFNENATWHEWYHESEVVGSFIKDRNVVLINIINGSHMVPYDKPLESRALFHIMDMLESNDKVDDPTNQYTIETFNYNLRKERIVFIKDELPEEILVEDEKEHHEESEIDQSDDEDSDDESDDEDNEKLRAQTHASLPNWLLTILFIALLVYILKYMFDAIIKKNFFSGNQIHSQRLFGSENSNSKQMHSSRLNEDLEPGLGNSEFDIEMDNNELDSNVLDDLDITKD